MHTGRPTVRTGRAGGVVAPAAVGGTAKNFPSAGAGWVVVVVVAVLMLVHADWSIASMRASMSARANRSSRPCSPLLRRPAAFHSSMMRRAQRHRCGACGTRRRGRSGGCRWVRRAGRDARGVYFHASRRTRSWLAVRSCWNSTFDRLESQPHFLESVLLWRHFSSKISVDKGLQMKKILI